MSEELNLVHDLAVILISAGVFTVISRALKQPLILGYIVAGFLVGPHISFFPGISSQEAVHQWSQIGIIFLLFALGLEFSFKKLLKVGSTALIMAGCQCLGMMAVGIMLGQAMGWETMESVFLGGMLSMSSTAIVIKAYDDLGLKNAPYASSVFGTLVVQDLIAIVLMVVLSTMAVSHTFSGIETIKGIGKLMFFLILWFLVGIFVIPSALQKAHKYMTDEILLIISIGLCFGMVVLAEAVGFSAALGAFVMGSILSETVEGEHIMKMVGSIKNLFAAIFFVSVGMMLDPSVIAQHWLTILVITVFALVGMSSFSSAGALLSGKTIGDSLRCGFSLSQIGEFSFILAGLGISLGVLRDFIYPVIIAVSVITTFTTPYMIKASVPVASFLRAKLPANIVTKLDTTSGNGRVSEPEKAEWLKLIKLELTRVVLYGVIMFSIMFVCDTLLEKFVTGLLSDAPSLLTKSINVAITLGLMSPFIIGMVLRSHTMRDLTHNILQKNSSNIWLILSLDILKMAIATIFIFMVLASHFTLTAWSAILLFVITMYCFFLCAKQSYNRLYRIESKFMANLNRKDEIRKKNAPVATSVNDKLSSYDVRLETVEISPDYPLIGHKLKNLPFRSECGVNIVKIVRGSRGIVLPSGDERVYPYDKLLAVGTRLQVDEFVKMVSCQAVHPPEPDFLLEKTVLEEDSEFTDRTLAELNLRERGLMVISVIRQDFPITNPPANFRFEEGDTVWVAGEKQKTI